MPKRDDLPPLERAVSDALDHVNHACHGLTSSWAYPEEFLEQLGDAGFEVAATVDLAELRRTAARADDLARGHADVYGDYQAAQARAEKAEAERDAAIQRAELAESAIANCVLRLKFNLNLTGEPSADPSEWQRGWWAAVDQALGAIDAPYVDAAIDMHRSGDKQRDALLAPAEIVALSIQRRRDELQVEVNHECCEAVNRAMEAETILRELLDPEPCDHFDHHGQCQTHGRWDDQGRCLDARGRELLAALDGEVDA